MNDRAKSIDAGAHSLRPHAGGSDPQWYKDAIIYEVRIRSFFDANDDGSGDLKGLTSKLDYLADLGITAIWLLPHYPSPGRDDGYDISDYTDVHADVGTLEDFDELVDQAHRRGLRIITELVLNHTSDQHPWFQRARRAPAGSEEREFYVWSDTADKYQEARIIFPDFEPSNWAWDPLAKAYFWHRFFAHQPDLNYRNPAVHEAMLGVVDFWLARGVDGLRLDAVPYLYEEEGTSCENLPATHAFLKKLRAHIDARFKDRMLLAEANQWPEDAARYFGDGDECHMNFHFPIMPRLFMAIHMEERFPIIDILRQTPELHPNCQWAMFLRNHDELTLETVTDEERDYMYRAYAHDSQMRINLGIRRRLAPLTGNDRRRMELLDALLFSMPGTPVLYYGDEIGMGDNIYLGDRNGVRTPMQWSADRNAGFSRANPQRLVLPIIIDPEYHFEALNVEAQQSNPNSLLWWHKRLIALRKRFSAFGRGGVEFLHPRNPHVLAFVRTFEDERVLVVANLSRHAQALELDLSAYKGLVPFELMGRTHFPAIGERAYPLMLAGHGFYWLHLEPPRRATLDARAVAREPPSIACSSSRELLFGSERRLLEHALAAFFEARGWLAGPPARARVVEVFRLRDEPEPTLVLAWVQIEYADGESAQFALPLALAVSESRTASPQGAAEAGRIVASLSLREAPGADGARSSREQGATFLLEAPSEALSQALVAAIARGARLRGAHGSLVAATLPAMVVEERVGPQARTLPTERLGATIACGDAYMLKLLYRLEEGAAPELEVGKLLHAKGESSLTPKLLGHIELRAPRSEPMTLAVLEEQIAHQGTAWQHARSELGRAYERVLALPASDAPPSPPTEPLSSLAYREPPAGHGEMIGSYRDFARLLGQRVAELHLALASSDDPAFAPVFNTAADQRSEYQNARNLIGRVNGALRRALEELPADAQARATRVLLLEHAVLGRLEAALRQRSSAARIRCHGDLRLSRALFTGKDYVLVDVGGGPKRSVFERRRKASAFRDLATIALSFRYAAATALLALRPEDQPRAAPWGAIWHRWAAAACLRGYLDVVKDAPFVAREPELRSLRVEAIALERAFEELGVELRRRPDLVWIPLEAILDSIGPSAP